MENRRIVAEPMGVATEATSTSHKGIIVKSPSNEY